MTPTLADRRARWAVSAVFFVLGAALGAWAPHIATVKIGLGLSGKDLGFSLLAGTMGAVTTMPFSGFLIHRVGSRAVVLLSGFGLLLVLPLVVIAPNVPFLVLSLYVMGIMYGQFDVAMNLQSLTVQDRYHRPVLSAIHGCFSIGGFAAGAGAAIAAWVDALPLTHLVVNSTLLAVMLVPSCRGLLPKELDKVEEEGPKLALPRGILIPIGILTMFSMIGEGALWDWAAVYLREDLHAKPAFGAVGFALFGLGMALGRFSGDAFVHRYGPAAVLAFGGGIAACGLLLSVSLPVASVAIVGFALAGLGIANLVPIFFAASGRQVGFSAAYGLAAVTTMGYTGFLAGPPAIGFIADALSLGWSLGLVAILCLCVAIAGPRYAKE